MKKMIIMLVLLMFVLVGCNVPDGVKSALYTAEITAKTTAQEFNVQNGPWTIPATATDAEKIALQEDQIKILVDTMVQISENLETVVDYFRTGTVTEGGE